MGACGDAPVLLVNNKRMCSWMPPDKLDALIAELLGAATAARGAQANAPAPAGWSRRDSRRTFLDYGPDADPHGGAHRHATGGSPTTSRAAATRR